MVPVIIVRVKEADAIGGVLLELDLVRLKSAVDRLEGAMKNMRVW